MAIPRILLRARRLLRRFGASERGNIALVIGLSLPLLIAMGGGGIDIYRAFEQRSALQNAADAAALAGARQYGEAPSTANSPTVVAGKFLTGNFSGISLGAPTISADTKARTVDVSATGDMVGVFTPMIGMQTIKISAYAKAIGVPSGNPVCIQALNSSASGAISLGGSTNLSATPCTVWVNSTSATAISMGGGGNIDAAKVCDEGGSSKPSNVTPRAIACGPRPDPFASMNPPASGACTASNAVVSSPGTIYPGVYCGGATINTSGTVTMSPGTYVVRDGPLRVSGGSNIVGNGVTIVLEGTATLDLSGGGAYRLIAPTSGDYESFVFYQRPTASPGAVAILTGSGQMYYEGVIYFPTQTIRMSGTGSISTASPISAFIADKFDLVGNSTISFNYDPSLVTIAVPGKVFSGPTKVRLLK